MKHLLARFGGPEPDAERMVDLLGFLRRGSFLVPVELFGAQKRGTLLQVNEEVVRLQLVGYALLAGMQHFFMLDANELDFELGDIDDPRPWLEAYTAGVGSPLELKFLRLFEQHGFHPQKQVSVAPNPGEPPISIADFAVPDRRLAIYIDGAAFHVGQRLRRDRFIRQRLHNGNRPA